MATISVTLPTDGTTADVADYNTPVTTIVNEINGNLDNDNIDSAAAISGSKLADNSIDITAKASSFDGWIEVSDSWTYASATTITVPTDATTKYSVGDKIKFTQTSVKYFQVTAVASTTLTVLGIGGVTVANAAISDISYSKVETPLGFSQGWVTWTPTWTSSGSAPSIGNGTFTGAYKQIGKSVFFRIKFIGGSTTTWGTGNYFVTLPVPGHSGIAANDGFALSGYAEDSGVAAYMPLGARMFDTTKFYISMIRASDGVVSTWAQTTPFTWSTGDYWSATGFYEAA